MGTSGVPGGGGGCILHTLLYIFNMFGIILLPILALSLYYTILTKLH